MEGWLSEQEIDKLRERWEADGSPAVALRLAEEYRQLEQAARALEVLEASLETTPGHPAARIMKARCYLDLDQAEAARAELYRVVRADPSHLVANRLLVDVHARLGDPKRARDRLDFVAFLNGGEGGTAELERLLADAIGEPFVLPSSAAPRGLVMDSAGPTFPGRTRAASRAPRAVARSESEPFRLSEPDPTSYLAALFGEGLFSRPGVPAATGSEPGALVGIDPEAAGGQSPAPTLTLAELYRKQGHHEEAAGIFRAVLERQPGNLEAARALVDMQKEHSWPLSAEDLLGGEGDPNSSGGRTAGQLLKRYRERLRGEG